MNRRSRVNFTSRFPDEKVLLEMYRTLLIYILLVGSLFVLTGVLLSKGSLLPVRLPALVKTVSIRVAEAPVPAKGAAFPLELSLLQLIVVLAAARTAGAVAKLLHQPAVVGEMLAGVCLGPSLLGKWCPGISAALFPAGSLQGITLLSQAGLVFFMFVLGMDLDTGLIRKKARHAFLISHSSIVLPFFLGVTLAYFIYPLTAPPGVRFLPFALFIGTAMSITAFPVLARIVMDRGLTQHPLGQLVISCAAADDVTAWCLLAVVVALVKAGTIGMGLLTIVKALGLVAVILLVIKPLLQRALHWLRAKNAGEIATTAVFLFVLISAWTAEKIGIHALMGAFLAGTAMPAESDYREEMAGKVKDISVLVLLPVFFFLSGLRTRLDLLGDGQLRLLFALVLCVAVAGKFGGAGLAARLSGYSWHDAVAIGVLMNTRGLVELIVINIGYELGVLSGGIYTILVLMAITTTLMTSPLLDWVDRSRAKKIEQLKIEC